MKFSIILSVSMAAGVALASDMGAIGHKHALESEGLSTLSLLDTPDIPPFGQSVATSAPATTVEINSTLATSTPPVSSTSHGIRLYSSILPEELDIVKRQVHTTEHDDNPSDSERMSDIMGTPVSDSDFSQEMTVIVRSAAVPTTFQTITTVTSGPTPFADLTPSYNSYPFTSFDKACHPPFICMVQAREANSNSDDDPSVVIRGGAIAPKTWIVSESSAEPTPSADLEKRQAPIYYCPPGIKCLPSSFYHGEEKDRDDGHDYWKN